MRFSFINKFIFRIVLCLIVVTVLMLFSIVRVADISLNTKTVNATSNGYTVELNDGRGNIYDCNGIKLTGSEELYAIVFLPCEEAMVKFVQVTKGTERENGLEKLRNKKPAVIERKDKLEGKGIYSYKIFKRYSNEYGTEHIIGYTDDTNKGITGLEKAFDDVLSLAKNTEIFFPVTASGEFLLGEQPEVRKDNYAGAVFLTLDAQIQKICNMAAENLTKGAIVVTEINTGKIRGMVSKPGFDVYNLKKSVNDVNSPFINRALSSFSVGSVFKPLVAVSLLENGINDFSCVCKGYSDIGDVRFYCNNREGHGKMNLQKALTYSCNCYFYNASQLINPKNYLNLSASFEFGSEIKLAEGIVANKGILPSTEQLGNSKGAVANFSIGQGNITLSPLAICNLYSAIANGGYYYSPTLVEGYTQNGKYCKTLIKEKKQVFSKETAKFLKGALIKAVETGTGKAADPIQIGAGGKTATAQTGQYSNGKEILNGWFCGFFPEKEPQYAAVILCEDAVSGGVNAAPIFKEIAEKICSNSK